MRNFLIILIIFLLIFPIVSAGVGISWNKESSLVPENTKTCMTYKVYNPWPEDSYVKIRLSDELMQIVSYVESEEKFVPEHTSSAEAIPIEFCFKTPRVYTKDCLLFNKLICKQECTEPQKVYEGEVEVIQAESKELLKSGAGGSATALSVSAPLRIKVQCFAHSRNYSFVYLVIVLIAGILLTMNLLKKKNKKKK